ncbi:MAG: histidinol-phosphate transaminase [Lachnospiraceae bacterium]|nr:histidinol-phosphate transaminase [Lachnospiraceae bacterium]
MPAWENNIRKVVPYVPGEQPKGDSIIKLNTNENPYPPSPRVLAKSEEFEKLRLYPDPKAEVLVEALAKYHHVDSNQVFVGVGSDDVLAMSFMTFFNSDKEILFPDITYSFYDVWAELFNIPYKQIPVDKDFRIIKSDYFIPNGGIVIANPNAPTGIAEPLSFIEDIVKNNPDSIVIVDEAYVDFGGETSLPLVDKYDNVVVVRTFSKSRSMAGVRIGYAISNSKLIKYLNDVKYSYNSYTMNMPSLALGVESIADEEYFQAMIKKVVDTREWFVKEINKLGFTCPKSSTNFVFATHKSVPATDIFKAARENNIILRHFSNERINNYLRITIGTKEEMEKLVSFLKKYVG